MQWFWKKGPKQRLRGGIKAYCSPRCAIDLNTAVHLEVETSALRHPPHNYCLPKSEQAEHPICNTIKTTLCCMLHFELLVGLHAATFGAYDTACCKGNFSCRLPLYRRIMVAVEKGPGSGALCVVLYPMTCTEPFAAACAVSSPVLRIGVALPSALYKSSHHHTA